MLRHVFWIDPIEYYDLEYYQRDLSTAKLHNLHKSDLDRLVFDDLGYVIGMQEKEVDTQLERYNNIKQLRSEGWTYEKIAKIYGVTRNRIRKCELDGEKCYGLLAKERNE